MVSAIILSYRKGWTIKEMLKQIDFNLLTRTALGLNRMDDTAFCEATFFNFQNRLLKHFTETGENLLETIFDGLTKEQLKKLKIKTDIQRSDSFMAMSNIRNYGRVQLLIEMLIRLYRILKEEDKERFKEMLSAYTKQTSGQYIYQLERTEIPKELEKLGQIYHKLYEALKERYKNIEIFPIFERVYQEHFTIVKNKVTVKKNEELHSGIIQSPDDIDATYRKKDKKIAKGQSVNVTETANPENELNLLTDIAVRSNNTDDSDIMNDRIETLKEKTPDLKELHTDGGYGSEDNDQKFEKLKITHIQTAVRGRKSKVEMKIDKTAEGEYEVSCLPVRCTQTGPLQKVESEKTRSRHKVCFDKKICDSCLLAGYCPTLIQKRVYYFTREQYLANKRKRNINTLPLERMKLRPNVEATIKEFVKPFNHKGKLRIRGQFKTMIYACSMGISINFGRIHRYLTVNPNLCGLLGLMKVGNCLFFKKLFQIGQKLRNIFRFVFFMVKFHQLPNFEIKCW
jgi:biotin-(acetyl-CoA carboxylase) ligase